MAFWHGLTLRHRRPALWETKMKWVPHSSLLRRVRLAFSCPSDFSVRLPVPIRRTQTRFRSVAPVGASFAGYAHASPPEGCGTHAIVASYIANRRCVIACLREKSEVANHCKTTKGWVTREVWVIDSPTPTNHGKRGKWHSTRR